MASIAENAEAVKIERQRASQLALAVQQKDQAVEEMRLRALRNEDELRNNMLTIQVRLSFRWKNAEPDWTLEGQRGAPYKASPGPERDG